MTQRCQFGLFGHKGCSLGEAFFKQMGTQWRV